MGFKLSACLLALTLAGRASCGEIDERADEAIRRFASVAFGTSGTPKYTFFYAEAKFAEYSARNDPAMLTQARVLVDAGLDHLNASDPPFQLWRAMDCYLRWGRMFGAPLLDKFQAKLVASPEFDYHDTENKRWMSATARYLAQEAWPEGKFASGYSSADPTGKATLLARMETYVREGEYEHNSPTYFAMHYGPLRSLADFAKDPEIKLKAGLTAEWLLASAAGEWLDGIWQASTLRIYSINAFGGQAQYGAGTSALRLYFGGPTPANWDDEETVDIVQLACSGYRPATALIAAAQARRQPYTHRETHTDMATRFFGTTFMTPEYSLYSQHEEFGTWGAAGGMDQVQRWAVAFRRKTGNNRFFVQHPTDTKVQDLGATEYEQVLQSRNALIGVWNIPAKNAIGLKGQSSSNPIRGWIPENPLAKINEAASKGRIYLHYGNVMIALHLSEPFNWGGKAVNFTKTATKLGMVVETAAPDAYPGTTAVQQLAGFKSAFEQDWESRVDASDIPAAAPRMAYQALDGTRLETVFRSGDKVDGAVVAYERASWPLLDDPWVHQEYRGDYLTVKFGDSTRVYDFKNWKVENLAGNTSLRRSTRGGAFEGLRAIAGRHRYDMVGKRITGPGWSGWPLRPGR